MDWLALAEEEVVGGWVGPAAMKAVPGRQSRIRSGPNQWKHRRFRAERNQQRRILAWCLGLVFFHRTVALVSTY